MNTGFEGAGISAPAPVQQSKPALSVLVADDSKSQRTTLSFFLRKLGHNVCCASDGVEALDIINSEPVDLIISDWMMPNMTGPELCAEVRKQENRPYVYFILLTSKADTSAVSSGLASGADDYLSKPVINEELAARIGCGIRILELYGQLTEQNEKVERAYGELQVLHEAIDKDLQAAAKLQQSFIPEPTWQQPGVSIASHYLPAHHIGGDLIGHFVSGEDTLVAYSIDVSGHGISSALLCVQIAKMFDPFDPERNICFEPAENGEWHLKQPHEIAEQLNEIHQAGPDCDLYFTMTLTIVNLKTGKVDMCQCGHPAALVARRDGTVDFAGEGGCPIGLIPVADYETVSFQVYPGDRIFLYSDGVSECENADGDQFEDDRLCAFFQSNGKTAPEHIVEDLMGQLGDYRGDVPFNDDVSAILLEMTGERFEGAEPPHLDQAA